MVQRHSVAINATIMRSIHTWKYELFSFLASGHMAKRHRVPPQNTHNLKNRVTCGDQSVLSVNPAISGIQREAK